MQKENISK